jgi:catechol 2,3-dioxygenase-like lactoylglutathione lyase family enzyme/DNA-binding CsgD family transcriptional regulator
MAAIRNTRRTVSASPVVLVQPRIAVKQAISGREISGVLGYSADMTSRGRPKSSDVLTPTEWKVVEGVRHGLSNPQLAKQLGVSLDAIKYHVSNVLGKLHLTTRRELRAWTGVRKVSALGTRRRTQPVQQPATAQAPVAHLGQLAQVARGVRDVAASEAWYREVLGLKHLFTFGAHCFFDCGGVRLYLTQSEKPTQESVLYFAVEDIHATHAALLAKGVVFISAPHMIHQHADGTEEWMAFFADPDGRPLALAAKVVAHS